MIHKYKTTFVITFLFCIAPLSMAFAHGISEADKAAMLTGGNLQYLGLGAIHMLTGYDHLLFIFGVIFFLNSFKDIIKYMTAFTIGHSITLIFATLWGISANYYLVDAVIALSVIYKGFENIDGFKKFFGISSPNLMGVIFVFGLVHGFGLSTRFQQLPQPENFLSRLLSFNIGVELGQIIALTIMLVLIQILRKTKVFAKLSMTANLMLIAAGCALFGWQIYNYFENPIPHGHHEKENKIAQPNITEITEKERLHHEEPSTKLKITPEKKPHIHKDKIPLKNEKNIDNEPHHHGNEPHQHKALPKKIKKKPNKKSHSHGKKSHSH